MNLDVSYEELLPHPIEAVWAALTDPESISDWLMATSGFWPDAGCRFRMKTRRLSTTGWVDAEVIEIDPPQRMVWSWSANDGNPPSTVTFQLFGDPGGTRLRLRHVGEIDPTIGRILGEGWPGRITALAQTLDRGFSDEADAPATRGGTEADG
jgi:uncharacterized protein YndB with AHSA1/START domain